MTLPPLCIADDATFWPWLRWPEFAAWPDRGQTVVVLPVAGLADWGLGHALDAEETVLLHVLRAASQHRPAGLALLVAPPLRFVAGPGPGCAFAVEVSVAQALIDEVAASIAAAGFRRIVLYNSSPWNEELCDVAARDLRAAHGLQTFCVNLSAIELDFDADRHPDRRRLQTLLAGLTAAAGGEPAGEAGEILRATSTRLGALLAEIQGRAPLPDGGRIVPVSP